MTNVLQSASNFNDTIWRTSDKLNSADRKYLDDNTTIYQTMSQ